jgi:hypothetical protein
MPTQSKNVCSGLCASHGGAGWVPGVQCDVWRTAVGAVAVPATGPLYKVRRILEQATWLLRGVPFKARFM